VLLNRDTVEGIANGRITLVLRRWDASRAKAGGRQRTVAGTIRVDAVSLDDGYRLSPRGRAYLRLSASRDQRS
jgi:hypothetical protein